MDSLNHMKQSNIPKLRAAQEFPSWRRDFTGHLAQHCLVDVINSAFAIPALRVGNTPAAAAANIEREKALQKDERVYGYLVAALTEFPTLRNQLMDDPTLSLTEAGVLPSGSNMYKALVKEIQDNSSEAFYSAIETKISSFTQQSKPMPIYISELDNLFDQLPKRLLYTDSKKMLTLRKGAHKDYESFVKALFATAGITYAKLCSSLINEFHTQQAIVEGQAAALTESNKKEVAHTDEKEESANYVNSNKRQRSHHGHDRNHRDRGGSRNPHLPSQSVKNCYNCGKPGHFAAECWSKKSQAPNEAAATQDPPSHQQHSPADRGHHNSGRGHGGRNSGGRNGGHAPNRGRGGRFGRGGGHRKH